jgi:hypothetical protein
MPDISKLVEERGADYGHPLLHHSKTVQLFRVLKPSGTLECAEDFQVLMICDKLARFSNTWEHEDSMRDVAGYAECWLKTRELRREMER